MSWTQTTISNALCNFIISTLLGGSAYKNKNMFEKKEIQLLIALVEGHKAGVNLLRGFRKPTREEQDENAYYNRIIEKLNKI